MGEWDLKISRTEHMYDDIKQGFFSSNHQETGYLDLSLEFERSNSKGLW
jgi:hypothetical protein